jgi:hypothetical protein
MYTKEELDEKVKRYIKIYRLYYLDFPARPDEELFWQPDGDNEIELISDLETSHIENCIRRVKKDLKDFDDKHTKGIIVPLMENKVKHLKAELTDRMNKL